MNTFYDQNHNIICRGIHGEALKIKSPHWIKVSIKQEASQAVGICSPF